MVSFDSCVRSFTTFRLSVRLYKIGVEDVSCINIKMLGFQRISTFVTTIAVLLMIVSDDEESVVRAQGYGPNPKSRIRVGGWREPYDPYYAYNPYAYDSSDPSVPYDYGS